MTKEILIEEFKIFGKITRDSWGTTLVGALLWIVIMQFANYFRGRKFYRQKEVPKVEQPLEGPAAEVESHEPVGYELTIENATPDSFLSKNFQLWEVLSPDGATLTPDVLKNLIDSAQYLQVIRDYFGLPIIVTSGWRSDLYNPTVPDAADESFHIPGLGFDIVIPGISPEDVARGIKLLKSRGEIPPGGLKAYPSRPGHSGHTHIDFRGQNVTW